MGALQTLLQDNVTPMKPDFPASWFNPQLPAYGTFPLPFKGRYRTLHSDRRDAKRSCIQALKAGFRHLDTAFAYGNQDLISAAARRAKVGRKEIYVTSKLHQDNNNYDDARVMILNAVRQIWDVEPPHPDAYIDAFLLHYPGKGDPIGAWQGLIEASIAGYVSHIGVSNFEVRHLEGLMRQSEYQPKINQIEFHPWIYHEQLETLEYCRANQIALEGYSPLAEGFAVADQDVNAIAATLETTPARVLLKWCMQHGVKPIVGTRNVGHLGENAMKYEFTLSDTQMATLNRKSKTHRIRVSELWHWRPQECSLGNTPTDME